MGLARRAGSLEVGVAAARQAVRDGRARLVVVAEDAAGGQRAKVEAIAEARGVPLRSVSSSEVLGAAVGHGPVTALAVTNAGLAKAAMQEKARQEKKVPAEKVPRVSGEPILGSTEVG